MANSTRLIATCLFCFTILMCSRRANANILDDILAVVQQARDRATEARNRATEARDAARDVREELQLALQSMTTAIRDFIGEAVEDLKRDIEDELEGRAEFVGDEGCSPVCDQFRGNLVLLLTDLESISNSTLMISGIDNFRVDFGREIGLIQNLPGRVLFPLYRMLAVESNLFESGLLDRLTQTAGDLGLVADAFAEEQRTASADAGGEDARALLAAQLTKNEWWLQRIGALEKASLGVTGTGVALKIIGKAFTAAGETQFTGEAQVHGYVGGSLKNNRKKKIGLALEGVGDVLLQISNYMVNKIRYAVVLSTQDLILSTMEANQMKVLENQDRILQALNAGGSSGGGPGLPNPGCGAAPLAIMPLLVLGIVTLRAVRARRPAAKPRDGAAPRGIAWPHVRFRDAQRGIGGAADGWE